MGITMLRHKYEGQFKPEQIAEEKKRLRSSIFFLLLAVDPETSDNYPDVNVDKTFSNLLCRLGGMNELLLCQPEIVSCMSWLESAKEEFEKTEEFDFSVYRNCILTAGAEIAKLKEV